MSNSGSPSSALLENFPHFSTLGEAFLKRVEGPDHANALMVKRDGRFSDIALSEVRDAVFSLAAALLEQGVTVGTPVGLIAENRPEWLYSDYALMLTGGVNVPIYPTLTPALIRYILNDCSAPLLFVSNGAQYEKIRQVRAELPKLKTVVVFDDHGVKLDGGDLSYRELCMRGGRVPDAGPRIRAAVAGLKPDDLASLVYTSGTTGEPKGVMLTHDNFVQNMNNALKVVQIRGEDRLLSLLPLCHSFERVVDYICFLSGTTIAYAESVEKFKENLIEVQPTVMAGVPRLYEKIFSGFTEQARASVAGRLLVDDAVRTARAVAAARLLKDAPPAGAMTRLKHALYDRLVYAKLRAGLGGKIRFFISGGAALAKEHALFFHGAGLPIVEGYGLTETAPIITVSPLDGIRPGSPGKLIPNVEAKIAPDGEILTRSRCVMKGYFNAPEKSAEVLVDGWFLTGDIGHFDADGYLWITDRKKDLIKTSQGKYVAPQHVEGVLKKSRYITEAVVFGDARKYVAALLVPNFALAAQEAGARGWPTDPAALITHASFLGLIQSEVDIVQQELPPFEQIKKFALLPRDLTLAAGELTPTMKVRRRVIGEKFKSLIEPLFAD